MFFFFFPYKILAVELLRTKLNVDEDRQMKIFNWDVPVCIQNIYKYIGLFLFGAACCQLATDIAKLSIGRLRPHFITVSKIFLSKSKVFKKKKYQVITCGI